MPGPTRRCPHCGADIPSKAYQCSSCGERLDHPGVGRSVMQAHRRRRFRQSMFATLFVVLAVLVLVRVL